MNIRFAYCFLALLVIFIFRFLYILIPEHVQIEPRRPEPIKECHLRLPRIFGDGMVLQRGPKKHKIWGFTTCPAVVVTVKEHCSEVVRGKSSVAKLYSYFLVQLWINAIDPTGWSSFPELHLTERLAPLGALFPTAKIGILRHLLHPHGAAAGRNKCCPYSLLWRCLDLHWAVQHGV